MPRQSMALQDARRRLSRTWQPCHEVQVQTHLQLKAAVRSHCFLYRAGRAVNSSAFCMARHYWTARAKVCLLLCSSYCSEVDADAMVQPALMPRCCGWRGARVQPGEELHSPRTQPLAVLIPSKTTASKLPHMAATWWAGIRSEEQNISVGDKLYITGFSAAWAMTTDCPPCHCPSFIQINCLLLAQKQYGECWKPPHTPITGYLINESSDICNSTVSSNRKVRWLFMSPISWERKVYCFCE